MEQLAREREVEEEARALSRRRDDLAPRTKIRISRVDEAQARIDFDTTYYT